MTATSLPKETRTSRRTAPSVRFLSPLRQSSVRRRDTAFWPGRPTGICTDRAEAGGTIQSLADAIPAQATMQVSDRGRGRAPAWRRNRGCRRRALSPGCNNTTTPAVASARQRECWSRSGCGSAARPRRQCRAGRIGAVAGFLRLVAERCGSVRRPVGGDVAPTTLAARACCRNLEKRPSQGGGRADGCAVQRSRPPVRLGQVSGLRAQGRR